MKTVHDDNGFPLHGLNGLGASFDKGEGNYLQREKEKPANLGVFLTYHKRFCETCRQSKPKGKRLAVKGWKCDDCFMGAVK
jgi:hypothetical protein